jgi:hypothetical protein
MTTAALMLEAYPQDLGHVKRSALTACVSACLECAQACTACADACLSEPEVAELTKCIRTNLDCADLCASTAWLLSRHTGYDANLTLAVLQACTVACKTCSFECGQHAEAHEHCRICTETCQRCEQACRDLASSLGKVDEPAG